MVENPIIKSVGILLVITAGVFIGSYEVAQFFLKEAEYRKFWLKIWLIISVVIGFVYGLFFSFGEIK